MRNEPSNEPIIFGIPEIISEVKPSNLISDIKNHPWRSHVHIISRIILKHGKYFCCTEFPDEFLSWKFCVI